MAPYAKKGDIRTRNNHEHTTMMIMCVLVVRVFYHRNTKTTHANKQNHNYFHVEIKIYGALVGWLFVIMEGGRGGVSDAAGWEQREASIDVIHDGEKTMHTHMFVLV